MSTTTKAYRLTFVGLEKAGEQQTAKFKLIPIKPSCIYPHIAADMPQISPEISADVLDIIQKQSQPESTMTNVVEQQSLPVISEIPPPPPPPILQTTTEPNKEAIIKRLSNLDKEIMDILYDDSIKDIQQKINLYVTALRKAQIYIDSAVWTEPTLIELRTDSVRNLPPPRQASVAPATRRKRSRREIVGSEDENDIQRKIRALDYASRIDREEQQQQQQQQPIRVVEEEETVRIIPGQIRVDADVAEEEEEEPESRPQFRTSSRSSQLLERKIETFENRIRREDPTYKRDDNDNISGRGLNLRRVNVHGLFRSVFSNVFLTPESKKFKTYLRKLNLLQGGGRRRRWIRPITWTGKKCVLNFAK